MHEMSLALEIGRLAEQRLGTGACAGLVELGVIVGDDANVEPGALSFCLEAVLAVPPFGRGKPVVRRTDGDALRLEYLEVDDGRPDD